MHYMELNKMLKISHFHTNIHTETFAHCHLHIHRWGEMHSGVATGRGGGANGGNCPPPNPLQDRS